MGAVGVQERDRGAASKAGGTRTAVGKLSGVRVLCALVIALAATPLPASGVSACKAKRDARDGTIFVSAKQVSGSLLWGASPSTVTNLLEPSTCIASGAARNCRLGAPGSAQAITPPP